MAEKQSRCVAAAAAVVAVFATVVVAVDTALPSAQPPPGEVAVDLLYPFLPSSCHCVCSYQSQTGVSEEARFVLELEFIQCLASPQYLNCRSHTACETKQHP